MSSYPATRPSERDRSRQAGFTILQLIVTLGAISLALLIGVRMTLVTSNVTAATVFATDLDARVHRVTERLALELQSARRNSLDPLPSTPFGASTIAYNRAEGDALGEIQWSTPRRLELVSAPNDAPDGTDNDGDGLVDEREIWLVRDVGAAGESRSLMATQVAALLGGETANALDDNGNGLVDEQGLNFDFHDGLLLIRVSLQGRDPDGVIETRTAETAVRVRN